MVFNIDKDDFKIDATEDGFRLTRIDISGDFHTHLKNKSACNTVINNVINKKIPKRVGFYYLQSLIRLSDDIDYINKVQELINTRKSKGRKEKYYNSRNKS